MWPPTLQELKDDLDIGPADPIDDLKLERRLAAAVTFVQDRRRDAFETDPETGELVEPLVLKEREAESIIMGTLLLASRLFHRRRTPDAAVWTVEVSADPDLSRMLKIGVHARPRVG
jgi:hypothetical protein